MNEFTFFVIGLFIGGLTVAVIMCCLQIHRLKNRKDDD